MKGDIPREGVYGMPSGKNDWGSTGMVKKGEPIRTPEPTMNVSSGPQGKMGGQGGAGPTGDTSGPAGTRIQDFNGKPSMGGGGSWKEPRSNSNPINMSSGGKYDGGPAIAKNVS